jgi:hypothetical protein
LEPFRIPPTRLEIKSCLLKRLWIQEDNRRIIEQEGSPQTEWLPILGQDGVQQQAIAALLALPKDDRRRSRVLQLLVSWQITLNLSGELEPEDQSLMGTLSQAYGESLLDFTRL